MTLISNIPPGKVLTARGFAALRVEFPGLAREWSSRSGDRSGTYLPGACPSSGTFSIGRTGTDSYGVGRWDSSYFLDTSRLGFSWRSSWRSSCILERENKDYKIKIFYIFFLCFFFFFQAYHTHYSDCCEQSEEERNDCFLCSTKIRISLSFSIFI